MVIPEYTATKITELELEQGLFTLLSNNPRFENIRRGSTSKAQDLGVDFTFDYDGARTILEVKATAPLTKDRIDTYIALVKMQMRTFMARRAILAVTDAIQPVYKQKMADHGIEVWDIPILTELFSEQLHCIQGTPFFDNLIRYIPVEAQDDIELLIRSLQQIPAGKTYWSSYQRIVTNIFELLFVPPLNRPISEKRDQTGVNRRDVILPNYAEEPFWKFLREKYLADYIIVDDKNYKGRVGKEQVLQMANYLKAFGTGLFGIICYRVSGPDSAAQTTCREHWIAYQKMIIFLGDSDLIQMLTLMQNGQDSEKVIHQKIEDFRIGL